MNNKFVTHSNGKITRIDLTDGLIFHKQNALPTSINLPEQSGQYVLNCDGSRGYSFELKEEQASIQLIPSQFMNADNTCAFSKGYPSLLIANSANDWAEMKLTTEYFQIIRCNGGVYDTVNLNSTVFASVAGFNKQNCSANTILYVDGSDTKTDNRVKGISLPSTGPYFLNNNLSNSSIDAMYVNAQNLFKNCLGVNSNNKGFITYEGNTASKINLPNNAGYYSLMRDSSGNNSFSAITLDRVIQSEIGDERKTQTIIPYMKEGSCRSIIAPTVTQTTNCLMTVNADKTMSLTPLSDTSIGQVSFESHTRYNNVKTVSGGIISADIAELFPSFTAKTAGTYDITVHVVMYIEDISIFDNITSDSLATITLTCGDYSDTMYIMNPQQHIVDIKLSVPLAISSTPSLEFNLGKNATGCTILPNYGKCLVTQYSNI